MIPILIDTKVALVPLIDGRIGFFGDLVSQYFDQYPTTSDTIALPNGVLILGVVFVPKSDDELVSYVEFYYDDSACVDSPWIPTAGFLGENAFGLVKLMPPTDAAKPYKVARAPMGTVVINQPVVRLVIA